MTTCSEQCQTEAAACAVCEAREPRPYRQRAYAWGGRHFDLVRCAACGHVYVHPRPARNELGRMYEDPSYYTDGYNLGVEDENYFERKDQLLLEYDQVLRRLEAEVGPRGSLFELGAAGGFLLEAARGRGWRAAGVEVSPVAARYAREELGLDVYEGQLADSPYGPASFDVVVGGQRARAHPRPA